MKNFKVLITFLLAVILSCSNKDYDFEENSAKSSDSYEEVDFQKNEKKSNSELQKKIPSKIIKTASLNFEVENFEISKIQINDLIKKYNSYIADEDENQNNYRLSNKIIIRCLSENFDTLINEIIKISKKLDYKKINLKDVGEEFFDIETRLKNKKKVEKRYLDLLEKANTINEILAVEEKARVIREEIESKEGRLKFLKDKISYSTIVVYYYKYSEKNYIKKNFFNEFIDAIIYGWDIFLSFIIGIFHFWVFIIIIIILIIAIKKFIKKK